MRGVFKAEEISELYVYLGSWRQVFQATELCFVKTQNIAQYFSDFYDFNLNLKI